MMNGQGKSDGRVVPAKSPNKAGQPTAAEEMEGSLLTKGNSSQQNTHRIQGRERMQSALGRVRQRALNDKKLKFTSLMHHIRTVDTLREAYYSLKRDAAAGIDGETWRHYEESLEENLQDLSGRLKRGAYRAKPVRRTYIPKADGKQRPLGVPVLEDKIVQYAAVLVLNAIYETEFRNFSYGYRPGRSQHNCLDALYVGIVTKKVNWIIDADIRGFFDTLDHGWLVKFIEHRIGDPRVVRLIQKWLRAGVMERGQWQAVEEGTPQGGVISPLLSNVFLHYGAPGQTWCFQRVKFPSRQEVQPPHRESSLGSEEVTNRIKRRQSDARAVTKVKRLSLVKYLTAGRQYRSGWKAPVGTPQTARWPETAAGSESTARSEMEASRDLGDPLWSWSASKQIEYAGR